MTRFKGCDFAAESQLAPTLWTLICRKRNLVIEVDGGQHADPGPKDFQRTKYLGDRGFRVIRFWNHDVLANTDGVITEIFEAL